MTKNNWEIKKLGEVLTIERGGSPRPIKKYLTNSFDGINWIKISDATASEKYIYETKEKITRDGLHKTRVVNDGDFILSNSMSFGRPYIMKTTGCIHDGWLVLKQNGKKIFETEFLYYLLSSPYVFQQFNYLAAGSTVRNLNIALVSSVEVPIPPLPEQKHIVNILDKAFTAIDKANANAEQNLQNSSELFDSYLNKVFANPGEDWEEKKLGEVCEFVRGPFGGSLKKNIFKKDGYAVYEQQHAIYDQFENIRYFIDDKKFNEMRRFELNTGDLIMSCSGTMGKMAIVPENIKRGIINQALLKLAPSKIIVVAFLKLWMQSESFQESLKAYSQGAAIQNVASVKILKEIAMPVPSIKEQQTIVQQLDALLAETKKLESTYQKKIDDLEELKKSILQKAFNGELKTTKAAVV
ncbi:restriction endonuclease subunit S [Bacteroidota bacterium]